MLKRILAVIATTVSIQAHALGTQTVDINTMTHPAAQAFLDLANTFHQDNTDYTAVASYKVTSIKPSATKETVTEKGERVLKSLLHRDYPITGDDGGYSLYTIDSAHVDIFLKFEREYQGAEEFEGLSEKLIAAAQAGLIVYYGSGAGNNTYANIWATLDTKTGEIVYFMSSNFGSDD
jgi:hypothetical protein